MKQHKVSEIDTNGTNRNRDKSIADRNAKQTSKVHKIQSRSGTHNKIEPFFFSYIYHQLPPLPQILVAKQNKKNPKHKTRKGNMKKEL